MPFPLLPVLLAAGAAVIFAGGRRKQPAPGTTPPQLPPIGGGETPFMGRLRLADILAPWLQAECHNHIVDAGNPDFIADEYTQHLGKHLLTLYDGFLARGNTVDDSVAAAIFESGPLCGVFLPPGWSEISEAGREAAVAALSPEVFAEQLGAFRRETARR